MGIRNQYIIIYKLAIAEELRMCVLHRKLQPRYIVSEVKHYWTGLELMDFYHNPDYLFEKLSVAVN